MSEPYVPRPGSAPARIVAFLTARAGRWVPTCDIVDGLDIRSPTVLTSCDAAITAGWIRREQRDGRWFWTLGQQAPNGGKPVPVPEHEPAQLTRRVARMVPALDPEPMTGKLPPLRDVDATPAPAVPNMPATFEAAIAQAADDATVAALEDGIVAQAGTLQPGPALPPFDGVEDAQLADEKARAFEAAAAPFFPASVFSAPPSPILLDTPDDDPDFREVERADMQRTETLPIEVPRFLEVTLPSSPAPVLDVDLTLIPDLVVGRRVTDLVTDKAALRFCCWDDGAVMIRRGDAEISIDPDEALRLRKFLFRACIGGGVAA